jgi:tetratricopeptide (TPR) repeat protein
MAMGKEDFDVAYTYFKQAIELEEDDDRKAEYYHSLGIITNKQKKFSESRQHALDAANLKPGWGEPYILIGNLYANSLNTCSDIKLPKAVFWVAVDMFVKAKQVDPSIADKANELINTYSGYFPNKEEAFFHNIIEGSTFKVECWINENTKVRF